MIFEIIKKANKLKTFQRTVRWNFDNRSYSSEFDNVLRAQEIETIDSHRAGHSA